MYLKILWKVLLLVLMNYANHKPLSDDKSLLYLIVSVCWLVSMSKVDIIEVFMKLLLHLCVGFAIKSELVKRKLTHLMKINYQRNCCNSSKITY